MSPELSAVSRTGLDLGISRLFPWPSAQANRENVNEINNLRFFGMFRPHASTTSRVPLTSPRQRHNINSLEGAEKLVKVAH